MAKKFIKNMKSTTSFAPLRNVISDYTPKKNSQFDYNAMKKMYWVKFSQVGHQKRTYRFWRSFSLFPIAWNIISATTKCFDEIRFFLVVVYKQILG